MLSPSKITSIALLGATALWLVGTPSHDSEEPHSPPKSTAPVVQIQRLHAKPIIQNFSVTAEILPEHDTFVPATSQGTLNNIKTSQGASVYRGQILAEVDNFVQKAALESAIADLANATEALNRATQLKKTGAISQAVFDSNAADVKRKKETVEAAKLNYEKTQITAPFSGLVVDIEPAPGQWLNIGDPTIRIASVRTLIAEATIPQNRHTSVSLGQEVSLSLPNGLTAAGTITHISPVADRATRSFKIEISIDNDAQSIPAGVSATAYIKHPVPNAVIVPQEAIVISEDGRIGVNTISHDKIVHFTEVDILSSNDAGLIVSIETDELAVITKGQSSVTSGDIVEISEANP